MQYVYIEPDKLPLHRFIYVIWYSLFTACVLLFLEPRMVWEPRTKNSTRTNNEEGYQNQEPKRIL